MSSFDEDMNTNCPEYATRDWVYKMLCEHGAFQGEKGDKGCDGRDGETGERGFKGDKGDTGKQGLSLIHI